MGLRQRRWAKKAYEKLLLQLGGRCVQCGRLDELSIDHIDGCEWTRHRVEWSHRVSIYRREAKEGKLQVLCLKCNSTKGSPVVRQSVQDPNQPEFFGPNLAESDCDDNLGPSQVLDDSAPF